MSRELENRHAEYDLAVQDGDAEPAFRNLVGEVPGHSPLARQVHKMHLRHDAAAIVMPSQSSPDGPAQVFGDLQALPRRQALALISCQGFVLAEREDGMSNTNRVRIVVFG